MKKKFLKRSGIFNNNEYDQEIPQSQTVDKPMAQQGRAPQQSPDTREDKLSEATGSLSLSSSSRWLQNYDGHKLTHNET